MDSRGPLKSLERLGNGRLPDASGDWGEDEDVPLSGAGVPRQAGGKAAAAVAEDTQCGLGGWRPEWLQRLASKKTYVLVNGLLGMVMFGMGSYFVGTLSTIEKRFKIPSRTTGLISSAWDVGSMCALLVVGYLGSRGHKTRYMAAGTFVVGLSCFLFLSPHLLFGAGPDAVQLTRGPGASREGAQRAVGGSSAAAAAAAAAATWADGAALCGAAQPAGADRVEECSGGGSLGSPALLFILANVCMGVGGCMYFTLGIAYLDDNTRKNKAPVLLAITQCIRMLGPTLGFMMASYSLSQYVDPSLHPVIDTKDPRWIGAWWMGYVPFGAVTCGMAGVMLLFPKQLPRAARRKALALTPGPPPKKSIRDFQAMFGRLLRNKVLVYNTLSGVCCMFGYIGYWTFMPKYMETQYRQSAADASLISGSVGLVFTAAGIMGSALFITKFQPRPRYLAAWNVFTELVDVLGHVWWAFLSCPADQPPAGSFAADNSWNVTSACNAGCGCGPEVKYAPVCWLNGSTTFYSACHAGCGAPELLGDSRGFSECACVPGGRVADGPCPADCSVSFTIFIVTQCVTRFLGSSGKAGNMLIQFRCVNEEDKPLSIAFAEFLACALAYIPAPVAYGVLLDSACLVWGWACGRPGNCWLYDGTQLRYLLNFTAAGCLAAGLLLDVGVWYYVGDVRIYDEDEADSPAKRKKSVVESILEGF